MYADTISDAMRISIDETKRRRDIQVKYNEDNGIVPKTIKKKIQEIVTVSNDEPKKNRKQTDNTKLLKELEEEMKKAASELDFERAMELRDIIFEMKVK